MFASGIYETLKDISLTYNNQLTTPLHIIANPTPCDFYYCFSPHNDILHYFMHFIMLLKSDQTEWFLNCFQILHCWIWKRRLSYPIPTTRFPHHHSASLHVACISPCNFWMSYFILPHALAWWHNYKIQSENTSQSREKQFAGTHRRENMHTICILSTSPAEFMTTWHCNPHFPQLSIEMQSHLISQSQLSSCHISLVWTSRRTWSSCPLRAIMIGTITTIETQHSCGVLLLLEIKNYIAFQITTNFKFAFKYCSSLESSKTEGRRVSLRNSLPPSLVIIYTGKRTRSSPFTWTLLAHCLYTKQFWLAISRLFTTPDIQTICEFTIFDAQITSTSKQSM